MHTAIFLLVLAVVASVYLAWNPGSRLFGIIGVLASGIALLVALGTLSLRMRGINLGLVLGAGILVAGCGAWVSTRSRMLVTAATALAFIGVVRLLVFL